MVGVLAKSIIDVLSLVLLQLAFYGVLKQDNSIPSQVPRSSTTLQVECVRYKQTIREEDEEEPKVFYVV